MYSHGRLALTALVVLGLTTIFAGCSDNPAGPATTSGSSDQELRSLTQDPAFSDYFTLNPLGQANTGPATPVVLSPITDLVEWHRDLTGVTQQVEVHTTESLSTITVTSTMNGQLVLTERTGGQLVVHQKPLVDVARRNVTLERTTSTSNRTTDRWRLVSVSNVAVESAVDGAAPTVHIESVQIDHGGTQTIITDPLAEMAAGGILALDAGEEVTVTVQHSGGDAVGFLRYGGRSASSQQRIQLEAQADGSLVGHFTVPSEGGIYYASVDLLTNGSLFESDPAVAPYDSNQWDLIYRVGMPDIAH